MCKLDNIANILERLSGDPLYHASLGSKELFHTNLLAWLCDAYPQEMQKVLPIPTAKPGAKGCAPAREEHDLDLVVRFAGRAPLVIENKVKSLPNHAQLRAYDKVLNRDKELRGAKRALLSLAEPQFSSRWTHMSYAQLTSRLRPMTRRMKGFDGQFVEKWCNLLDDLNMLSSLVTITDGREDYFFLEAYDMLRKSRLHGLVYRLRAQDVLNTIESSLRNMEGWSLYDGPGDSFINQQNRKPLLAFGAGFRNETPIIDVHCKLPGKPCIVGVQI